MKNLSRWCVVLFLVAGFGCIPSLNPLYTDESALFDPDLVGMWEAEAEPVDPEDYDFSFAHWRTLDVGEIAGEFYQVETVSPLGERGMFTAHLVRVGEALFLDLFPGELNLPEADEEEGDKAFEALQRSIDGYYLLHFRPLHTFLKVEKNEDALVLSMMDPDWLEKIIRKNPREVAHSYLGGEDDMTQFVLTDTPENLQAFLARHLDDERAFTDHTTFRRRSRISRNRAKENFWMIDSVAEADAVLAEYPGEIPVIRVRAKLLAEDGRYDEAVAEYTRAIESDSFVIDDIGKRAKVYMQKGDYPRAIADFKRINELAPNKLWKYVNFNKAESAWAIRALSEMIELEPANKRFYFWRIENYRRVNDLDGVIADYSALIELEPGNLEHYGSRAWARYNNGDFAEAIADYSRMIEMDPGNTDHYARRAGVYMGTGQHDLAVADRTRMIEMEPGNTSRYTGRAALYRKLGEHDLALADMNQAIEIEPTSAGLYLTRANIHLDKNDHGAAITDMSRAIELDDNTHYYHIRMLTYLKMGECRLALADVDTTIEMDPALAENYKHKAWILATCPDDKYRDGEQAVALAGKAIRLFDFENPNYLDTLAAAYAEAGRFEEAVATVEEAIALHREDYSGPTYSAEGFIEMEKLEAHLAAFKAGRAWRQ